MAKDIILFVLVFFATACYSQTDSVEVIYQTGYKGITIIDQGTDSGKGIEKIICSLGNHHNDSNELSPLKNTLPPLEYWLIYGIKP